MFRIPDFYMMSEMTFDEACNLMKRLTSNGGLLEGLEYMNKVWADYIASDDQDDDEFYENWIYEVNAFNVVYENMSKLFEAKEV